MFDLGLLLCVRQVSGGRLAGSRFNNRTGADAAGADPHPFAVAAGGGNSYTLQIWQPAPSSFVMGMAYIISGGWFFATYRAHFGHFFDSFTVFLNQGHIQRPKL